VGKGRGKQRGRGRGRRRGKGIRVCQFGMELPKLLMCLGEVRTDVLRGCSNGSSLAFMVVPGMPVSSPPFFL